MTGKKPVIHDLDQLHKDYARYRQALCQQQAGLEERLMAGTMAMDDFMPVAATYPVIFFDALGVLTLGKEPIAGAVARVNQLRHMGKQLRLVTNNASQSPHKLWEIYQQLGFGFRPEEIITSGMAVRPQITASGLDNAPCLLIGSEESRHYYAPTGEGLCLEPWQGHEAAYILMCSNRDYYQDAALQQAVEARLAQGETRVMLANPDLVAPEADGRLNPVAGYTVARWQEHHALQLIGLGKPFSPIFHLALQSLPPLAPEQVLMVGDTLDTDILGGIAMGFATCLTSSGSYRGMEPDRLEALCRQKGICPHYRVKDIGQG